MAGFFNKIKSAGTSSQAAKDAAAKKNAEPPVEATPLEKMLQNAGPLRKDGSDRFYGFENFGNTCYCNSIVQALFYSDVFRENVISYPTLSPADTPDGTRPRVEVTIRPPMTQNTEEQQEKAKALSNGKKHPVPNGLPGQNGQPIRPEDKPDTPEYKKKQAMLKGPILELAQGNPYPYGMNESTFTALKDVFLALIESKSRTGVLSPQRFLEIFKRQNEYFQTSMHQDAHEFYGLVLNDVIKSVEENAEKMREKEEAAKGDASLAQSVENAIGSTIMRNMHGYRSPGTGWVHEIFEGVLTSETTCLTCETASQRDETFIDLSIDLEEHSSVTSCLRKFSREEMLCEKNKFHCDHCGGLQEAEKRMMIKRLPKILTLHLKRFKYTEDFSRLQKLFHRVVYPSYLRMFTTTEDAVDPDRLYELYAVVVHIGGNAYHGHYVSIIKTKDRGWLLFDDEMVEPVDKNFVKNFFGDKPGMATAYVLFYQETTFEEARANQEQDGLEEVVLMDQAANVARDDNEKLEPAPLRRQATQPLSPTPDQDNLSSLAHAHTAPDVSLAPVTTGPTTPSVPSVPTPLTREKTKDELKKEKKEREAAEKAEKKAQKQAEKERKEREQEQYKKARIEQWKTIQGHKKEQEELDKALEASRLTAAEEQASRGDTNGDAAAADTTHASVPPAIPPAGALDRTKRGSKSLPKRSFSLFGKDRSGSGSVPNGSAEAPDAKDKDKSSGFGRLSIGLGRKKSTNMLS